MLKMNHLWYIMPVCAVLSFGASAAETAPVELVGENAAASALDESMQVPPPPEKETKPKAVRKRMTQTTTETVEEDAEEAAPAPSRRELANKAPAADKNYVIQAGDVLQITVWKEADMDREVLVLPDGTISFPLIGSFKAEGYTPAQVQTTIKHKLKSLIPDASVTVLVKAALGNSVSVIGQVQKPGELVMGHQLTVMQALSQAGGLTPFASEGSIIILRRVNGTETSIEFPYDDVIRGRNLDKNIALLPGDVVVVPTASLF